MSEAQRAAVIADQPELMALANLAAVAPSKVAAAFNDTGHFFEHLGLEELARLQGACERLGALGAVLATAAEEYLNQARLAAEAAKVAVQVTETLNAD